MAPKIQAIIWYLEAGGKQALITNPENIGRAIKGETGTWIVPAIPNLNPSNRKTERFESPTIHE